MMTHEGDWESFLDKAEANPGHYGKHGLRAFEAALHGNITLVGGSVVLPNGERAPDGYPWSFRSWDAYNRLLDAHDTLW